MPTLDEIIEEAARNAGYFWEGTTSAVGTNATLVDDGLIDSERPSTMGKGGFIYLPAAVAGDKMRRVSGVTPGSGTINNAGKVWANAGSYAGSVAYQWYGLVPPHQHPGEAFSWKEAVNRGLQKVWYEDWDATMTGNADGKDRFDITAIAGVKHVKQIRGVSYRNPNTVGLTTLYDDRPIESQGGLWRATGPTEIWVFPAPGSLDYVRFNYVRPYVLDGVNELATGSDQTACPMDVALRAAVSELYQYLDNRFGGRWAGEAARSLIEFHQSYARIRPRDVILWG